MIFVGLMIISLVVVVHSVVLGICCDNLQVTLSTISYQLQEIKERMRNV